MWRNWDPPAAPHCQWDVNSLAILEKQSGSSSHAKYRVTMKVERLFAAPWTIQSLEFSRPEYWSG